jgi:hypothetical protein
MSAKPLEAWFEKDGHTYGIRSDSRLAYEGYLELMQAAHAMPVAEPWFRRQYAAPGVYGFWQKLLASQKGGK